MSSCCLGFFLFITCNLCVVGLHPWMPFSTWTLSLGILCLCTRAAWAGQLMLLKVALDHEYLDWRYICRCLSYSWYLINFCMLSVSWLFCIKTVALVWSIVVFSVEFWVICFLSVVARVSQMMLSCTGIESVKGGLVSFVWRLLSWCPFICWYWISILCVIQRFTSNLWMMVLRS